MTLKITILSASLVHDTELIGHMSPYIKVSSLSKFRYLTQVSHGNRPEWNEILECSVEEKELTFEVLDKETVKKDDYVGKATLFFRKYLDKPNEIQSDFLELRYEDSPAGTIAIHVLYNDCQKFVGSEAKMNLDLSGNSLRPVRVAGRKVKISSFEEGAVDGTKTVRPKSSGSRSSEVGAGQQHHKEEVRSRNESMFCGLKRNLFSWLDNFKWDFEVAPARIRRSHQ